MFSHFIDLSLASASRPHGPQTSDAFSEWTANMKKTWIDLLYELPVDATLREFLTGQGLPMPDDFAWTDKPVFGVQYHPEASPGPHDSHYLFQRFAKLMAKGS